MPRKTRREDEERRQRNAAQHKQTAAKQIRQKQTQSQTRQTVSKPQKTQSITQNRQSQNRTQTSQRSYDFSNSANGNRARQSSERSRVQQQTTDSWRNRTQEQSVTRSSSADRNRQNVPPPSGRGGTPGHTEPRTSTAKRVLANTGRAAGKGVQDSLTGFKKTMYDIGEMASQDERSITTQAIRQGIKLNDQKKMSELEAKHKKAAETAKQERVNLQEEQDKRQEEFDKRTKGAKGLEKALYGAAESGAGMLTDLAVGAVTGTGELGALASMGARTYGQTRGQAEKEGATETEDRLNALLQAGKEVGTERILGVAGLPSKAYGKGALSFTDRIANKLTSKLAGRTADVVGAGARLAGGVAEENIEEILGWGLDPVISEVAYKGNVRGRRQNEVRSQLQEESNALRSQITDEATARSIATYLSSDKFIEENKKDYLSSGLSEKQAQAMAEQMRDYLTASLTGDTKEMERLEQEMATSIAGKGLSKESWDFGELADTIAATTLLTASTGLPGSVSSTVKGNQIKSELGEDGIKALANTAIDFEDPEMSEKAQAMSDRIASGKEITATQAYDLQQGMAKQIQKDQERVNASYDAAAKEMQSKELVSPYEVTEDGSMALGEVTGKKVMADEKTAKTAIQAVNKENKDDARYHLSASEVQAGANAIAAFQSGIMTEEDANAFNYTNQVVRTAFTETTGIDLDQYIVKNKNGKIDIPATNAATKDALFVLNTENLVASAEAETANWMDNTKGEVVSTVSARMDANGTKALQQVLDNVDERDRSTYMRTVAVADYMYENGWENESEWDEVETDYTEMFPEIEPSVLRSMYEAGMTDRMYAEDEARGRTIEAGKPISEMGEQETATGNLFVESKKALKGTEIRLFTELASSLNADIHLVDNIKNLKGDIVVGANGAYSPRTNTFYLNVSTGVETNVGYIFMHEVTHYIKANAPEQYAALEKFVREKWRGTNAEQMQAEIKKKIDAYMSEQSLTEEEALEEIIADAAHEFINDPDFAKQIAEDDPTLAKAIIDSIKNILRKLRAIFASGSIFDDTHMNCLFSELDIFTEAEALWLDAYKAAVKNRANMAIDQMAERSFSISDTSNETFVTLSPERINSLISEYAIPRNKTSDYSKAWIATINPRDFLKLTVRDEVLDTWEVGTKNAWGQEVRDLDKEDLKDTRLMPYLKIDTSESHRVIGHEGRHRMLALYRAGYTEVPVVIQDINEATKNYNQPMEEYEGADLWSQDFGNGPVNDDISAEVYDTIPINEKNRAEIERVYGSTSEDQVKFSITPEQDADYMKAVEAGDMETAQRMVDQAAKQAGYNVETFHGTNAKFNRFKKNSHFGTKIYQALDRLGFYNDILDEYEDDPEVEELLNRAEGAGANVMRLYIKAEYPLEVSDLGDWDVDYLTRYLTDNYPNSNIDWSSFESVKEVVDTLKAEGYDSLVYENVREGRDEDEGDNDAYILFDPNQAKLADPVTYDDAGNVIPLSERFNTENEDIRFSITPQQKSELNDNGIEELEDGTTARYSLSSWNNTDKAKKLKALVSAGHNERTAKKWIKDVNSIASIILSNVDRLDYLADPNQRFLKDNGDYYKKTLDASTLCDKRRIYQGTYDAIQHALPNTPLMEEDVIKIRTLLKRKGYVSPCGICYVESQRKTLGTYAKQWYDNYERKGEISLDDVTTTDGLAELKKTNPQVASDFEKAMKAKGVQSPKVVELRTDYREDIMRMKESTVQYLNKIGGLRFHSFSDFESVHLIDTMQAIMDMATKNLNGMAYTKVPNFVAVFGPTGIKINLSLIVKTDENGNAVHDKDGRLVFDTEEGISYEEAKKWRDEYPDNVAFILVGKDMENTLEALNDDRIDYVIPFHKSKWSNENLKKLGLNGYVDFATGHQDNKVFVSEYWDYKKTGKENAEAYLKKCAERGVKPVFEQLLVDNGDGSYSLQPDHSTDNYWKLLVEGKMYNHKTGKGAPQKPVKPNFNMKEARRVLSEYKGGADTLPVADDVVNEFVTEYLKEHPEAQTPDIKLSISAKYDEPYMDAVERGDMDEAQRLVDEAARESGMRVVHRYHGTMNASFTVFDKSYAKVGGNSGAGFYFSTDKDDSLNHYQDVEGADNYFKWSSLAEQIHQQIDEGDWEGPDLETYEDIVEYAKKELNENPGTYDVYLNYKTPYLRDYRNSTNIYDKIIEDFDESDIDRDDYDTDDDYDDALYEAKIEHIYKAIDSAVIGANSDLESNYEVLGGPMLSDIVSELANHAYEWESLTWSDIEDTLNQLGTTEVTNYNWTEDADANPEFTRAIIENFGYDAIEDKEVSSKFGQLSREMMTDTEHIIVFKPEQIKLSDPVTYADDGSVIPLSQRFDPNNDDIRYSMPTQDSEGNILTDGQMEYFKHSQARDRDGRLVPVYHTTNRGGFTVFDTSYSEDGRSIFFTNSEAVSKTYGTKDSRTTYECYLNLENPLIVDADYNAWDAIPMTRRVGNISLTEDYDTNEVSRIAFEAEHDGVIIKHCRDWAVDDSSEFDTSENSPYSTIYIAFSSNQVKDIRNENPTENPDIRFSMTPEEDAISWIASQFDLDDVPLDDEVAEEGRIRMAKSKDEYIHSRNLLWNERWLTEGKVLDEDSVKGKVRQLVMGVMANSDTSRKYKTDLVNRLVIDLKSAFWMLKDGKAMEAEKLLWDSAVSMIEDVDFIDDTTYKNYKGLREYLRNTSFQLGEEYWQDVDYQDFRKRNFGRIKLIKGETNIDKVYTEMKDQWPEFFDEEAQSTVPDQLLHIEEVLDEIQPYRYAYSSEEAANLAYDIASDLWVIIYEGEQYSSVADTYKNKYDEQTKAMKARHEEALRAVREDRDRKVAREKRKFKEYKEKKKSAKERAKYFGRISKNIDWLTNRLINETKDKNIPEKFRQSLAQLLSQLDTQTERSKKLEAKYGPAKKTLEMRKLRDHLKEIASEDDTGVFRPNEYVEYLMEQLAEKVDGYPIDFLDTEDLMAIDLILRAIRHEISNYTKVRLEGKQVEIASIGDNTIHTMKQRIEKYGKRKTYGGAVGQIANLLNEGEQTPIYLFERLDPTGEGIGAMYKELRRGEDKHIQNMQFLRERFGQMFGDYFNKKKPGSKLEKWRNSEQEQTFNLSNGSITLNPAQMMSLYCLSKRPQALGHILGSGIVASPVNTGQKLREKVKGKTEQVNAVRVTYEEVQEIISKLTEDQIKLADEMQSLMNNEMAAWGNETSLDLHGIKLFREKYYFPIKSSGESLNKSADSFDSPEKIKNFGFTKPLTRNANNAIMLDDIFSVVADHCNKMSLYNAMAVPISDFMRVYNYKQRRDDGTVKTTVQAMIGEAFTRSVNQYIMKFIADVNANTKTRSDAVNDLMNKALANYKKASIGANFRVALQQPTAIFRSFMAISPKYFVGVKISRKEMREMFEHCPIAQWKSWGHYDMDMGRDVEDIMMNNDWSKMDVVTMSLYGELDNLTWSMIWQAAKNKVKAEHPDVEVGSDKFFKLANEVASEVFDKTQVVDSIFHRSDTMRSKNTITKMATSFMAEPTLTYNVFRDSVVNAYEAWKDGNHAEAVKLLSKMSFVLALNAAAVSASAAIWDAVRGKSADGDDDKKWTELWFENFIENFRDNANMINNIYFVKDIYSLKDGWGTSNMALEGWETLFKGIEQIKKKIEKGDEYINRSTGKPYTWYDVAMTALGGVGYITGVPIKTTMRDAKAIMKKLGIDVYAETAEEETVETDDSKTEGFLSKFFHKDKDNAEETKDTDAEIEAKVKEYEDSLGDKYSEDQKKKLVRQYKKTLKAEVKPEEDEEDLDYKFEMMSMKAEQKATEYSGADLDDALWDVVGDGYSKKLEEYDFEYIANIRAIYKANGGDPQKFDAHIVKGCKSAYKKTFTDKMTDQDIYNQNRMRVYMLDHGVSAEEISDMCYHTDAAKDLKAALRMNNDELIMKELVPLVRAGLTRSDWEKLVKYQNYGAKTYDGKYNSPEYKKSTGTYVWPTQGQITSGFGYRRSPTAGASSNHPAIDIGAPQGSPVVAADGGKIIKAGNAGGYGNQVAIQHENGTVTYYSHLYSWNVKPGDTVAQGQQIGQVGSTGISTGPHLDFKVEVNGEPVNPLEYLS